MDTSNNDQTLGSIISSLDQVRGEVKFPVTLVVGGAVITGQMVSGEVFFNKLGSEITDMFVRAIGKEAEGAGNSYKEFGETFVPSHPEYQDQPEYVFLTDAEILSGSYSNRAGNDGNMKIRLSDVSGFSLGFKRNH